MLMLLALGSEVDRIYRAALRSFTPDDIAEAFAATKGITVPGQLRAMVIADPRPLAKEFSRLAPNRRRIPIQRWTVRRITLTAILAGVALVAVISAILSLKAAGFRP